MLLKKLYGKRRPQDIPQTTHQLEQLLAEIKCEMSCDEIQTALGLKDRKSFRQRYLKAALEQGLIEMIIPEKLNSSLLKYRLKVP